MPESNGSAEKLLDSKLSALDFRVKERQRLVEEAFATHLPDLPLQLLRQSFGARIQMLRSPGMDYGHPDVLPGETSIKLTQIGPVPIKYSRRGRALFAERVKPLPRVRTASKMRP
jgi:hypothetical protein